MSIENRSRTLIFAVIIIAAGALLLLRSVGILPWEVSRVLLSWQMLLIVIGVFNIFSSQHKVSGYILLGIGGFFMLDKFYYWDISFWQVFWPMVLIGVGVAVLVNYQKNQRFGYHFNHDGMRDKGSDNDDYIDEVTIFSGTEKTITSQNFRGGKITSIFGGSEINLSQANLSPERNSIEVVSIFGGSTLIVPPDWDVKVNVTAVFGGFSDKRYKRTGVEKDYNKFLNVQGVVIFGGGEIKSY
ncbi:MAG: cell wall-active antibiotics response protein [Bacteroidales bacterium]|nr:cell wall-active antibiotics response protein [Bacteroidales bacterium]